MGARFRSCRYNHAHSGIGKQRGMSNKEFIKLILTEHRKINSILSMVIDIERLNTSKNMLLFSICLSHVPIDNVE